MFVPRILSAANKMLPIKKIKLIWLFYKSFLLASSVITVCCLALFWKNGFSVFIGIFWFKIITLGLIFYFINEYKSKEYYYYQNLGISKTLLWISILTFDFTLFIFLIIQTYQLK